MTTLTILVLATIKLLNEWVEDNIEPTENNTRKEKLTEKFLGNFSTSKLTITSKLILNRNNNDFFQSYLINHRCPANLNKLKPSQKRLWQAYEYYYDVLKTKFKGSPSGELLAQFIDDQISNGLIFTTINVSDDLNAYKVFETLNARGVKLSPADLLKNYLFSKAFESHQTDLEETERRWQNINDFLGKADIVVFLRHFWNSRNPFVRDSNLFRTIKSTIQTPKQVLELLNELEQFAPIYAAFENSGDPLWNKEQRSYIRSLNLFGVTTWYSMMLTAYQKFDEVEFTKLLHELNVLTFRYNVISGLHTNDIEVAFNKLSIKIHNGSVKNPFQAVKELGPISVSDENFIQAFSSKSMNTKRNKNLVKYILIELENYLSGTNHQFEDARSTIEHILPENPSQDWYLHFSSDSIEDYIYILGNYTLLEDGLNKKSGSKSFNEKAPFYKESKYKMSNSELNYQEWNPTILRNHQDKMAIWASETWRSKYFQIISTRKY